MLTLTESDIEFHFDDTTWTHLKKVDDHADYKKIEKLNGTKAVDFLGICHNDLIFIEVKNFRGHRIANKPKLAEEGQKLMTEIACKVKDTIAVVVGGSRNSTHEQNSWEIIGQLLLKANRNTAVVLWLEEDSITEKRAKAGSGIYTQMLKSKLKWLTGGANILVVSSHYHNIDGLTVDLL